MLTGGNQGEGRPSVSLRADHPFPPRDLGSTYFEVTLSNPRYEVEPDNDQTPIISVGFCGEFCDLTSAQVGWNTWSAGYHSDDGGIYAENSQASRMHETGHTFEHGNTVGCGIDYASDVYYFTVDGEVVGTSIIIYHLHSGQEWQFQY